MRHSNTHRKHTGKYRKFKTNWGWGKYMLKKDHYVLNNLYFLDVIQTCWRKFEKFHINMKKHFSYYFDLLFMILMFQQNRSFFHSLNNSSMSIYYAISTVLLNMK